MFAYMRESGEINDNASEIVQLSRFHIWFALYLSSLLLRIRHDRSAARLCDNVATQIPLNYLSSFPWREESADERPRTQRSSCTCRFTSRFRYNTILLFANKSESAK